MYTELSICVHWNNVRGRHAASSVWRLVLLRALIEFYLLFYSSFYKINILEGTFDRTSWPSAISDCITVGKWCGYNIKSCGILRVFLVYWRVCLQLLVLPGCGINVYEIDVGRVAPAVDVRASVCWFQGNGLTMYYGWFQECPIVLNLFLSWVSESRLF